MMGELFKLFGTIGLNNKDANKGIDETTGKAEGAASKIAGFFKKAAVAIGAAFAVQKIAGFGKMTVEAAASAKAIQAQFEQVFGNSQTQASDAINGMAKQFGMLPNRIKPSFTATTSMFKGLGLSTEEAMGQATKAVTIASDAAAFYDMSYENANGALSSFIKGNYEGGEAIGLFANETQMAAWASENLGVEWSSLSEADKQIARMQFAQTMQEAAGATGQASRESDSYENQLGNMKQAWQDFTALVGAPILGVAIQGLQTVTGWLQTAGDKVVAFQGWFATMRDEVANSTAFTTLKEVLQPVADAFQNMKDILSDSTFLSDVATKATEIKDAFLALDFVKLSNDLEDFIEKWLPLIAGISGAAAAFGIYTAVLKIKSGIETIAIASMIAMDWAAKGLAATMAFLTSPVTLTIAAIAALIAIGVLVWQNWDTIKEKALDIWGNLSQWFSTVWANISTAATEVWTGISTFFVETWTGIATFFSELWNNISLTVTTVWETIKNAVTVGIMFIAEILGFALEVLMIPWTFLWENFGTYITTAWETIKSVVSTALDAISIFISNIWNAISGVTTTAWNAIVSVVTDVTDRLWNALKSIFDSIQKVITNVWDVISAATLTVWNAIVSVVSGIADSLWGTLQTVFNSIQSVITSVWDTISSVTSTAWDAVSSTVTSVIDSISSTVSTVFDSIGSTVSTIWDGIQSSISTAIDTAKNAVSTAVDAILGIMDFSWSLPNLELPHFSISGSFSLNPPSVPKLGISWFKDGGILQKAMAFGMNGNDIMVGGEAGKEAVLPLNRETLGGIGQGIASAMGWGNEYIAQRLDAIIDLIAEFLNGYDPNKQMVMDTGALVGEIRSEMDKQLGNEYRLRGRGR